MAPDNSTTADKSHTNNGQGDPARDLEAAFFEAADGTPLPEDYVDPELLRLEQKPSWLQLILVLVVMGFGAFLAWSLRTELAYYFADEDPVEIGPIEDWAVRLAEDPEALESIGSNVYAHLSGIPERRSATPDGQFAFAQLVGAPVFVEGEREERNDPILQRAQIRRTPEELGRDRTYVDANGRFLSFRDVSRRYDAMIGFYRDGYAMWFCSEPLTPGLQQLRRLLRADLLDDAIARTCSEPGDEGQEERESLPPSDDEASAGTGQPAPMPGDLSAGTGQPAPTPGDLSAGTGQPARSDVELHEGTGAPAPGTEPGAETQVSPSTPTRSNAGPVVREAGAIREWLETPDAQHDFRDIACADAIFALDRGLPLRSLIFRAPTPDERVAWQLTSLRFQAVVDATVDDAHGCQHGYLFQAGRQPDDNGWYLGVYIFIGLVELLGLWWSIRWLLRYRRVMAEIRASSLL